VARVHQVCDHNHNYRLLILLGCLITLTPHFCGCQGSDEGAPLDKTELVSIGRELTGLFYDGDLDALCNLIVDRNFTIEELTQFREKVGNNLGSEVELLDERIAVGGPDHSYYGYYRFARFSKAERPVKIAFGFNNQSHVWKFSVESLPAEAPTRHANYTTKTRLQLPFKGAWYAASGGSTAVHNASHCVSRDQRYGSDFMILQQLCSFSGDGTQNEQYYAYNQQILAPGAGVVAEVVKDVPENLPGEMTDVAGNMVIIDHGNGEYSFLCHLKHGSIKVCPGDRVEMGQVIGRCGNSGHSTEPGLHYHLQNTGVLFEGEGLPIQFENYSADGEFIPRGVVLGGQTVETGK